MKIIPLLKFRQFNSEHILKILDQIQIMNISHNKPMTLFSISQWLINLYKKNGWIF